MSLSNILFKLAKMPLGDFIVGAVFTHLTPILPVNKIQETDKAVAFWHPKPYWEKHILIVPKKPIKNLFSIDSRNAVDSSYIMGCFELIQKVVKQQNWEDGSYSVLVNGGTIQEVNQLHFHLFSGGEVNENS